MLEKTKKYLQQKGYNVNEKAQESIRECNAWYTSKKLPFHFKQTLGGTNYQLEQLNFAKRICSDEANLCEIIDIKSESESNTELINSVLELNRFDTQYRKQLEHMSATGTVGAYIYLKDAELYDNGEVKNGSIKINYCTAENIIPLRVENDEVIDCAFVGTNKLNGKQQDIIVAYKKIDKNYQMTIAHVFEEKDMPTEEETTQLGEVKPFSIMTIAEVNNFDNMAGYGLPKLISAIPFLKGLDLIYNVLYGDLDKAEKIVLINEMFSQVDKNGVHYLTDEQRKYFLLMGEKLPEQQSLIQEHNPIIRIDVLKEAFELLFSLLSQNYGYGNKKYSFNQGTVTTATQYILEKSDEMQSLNKQRFQSELYIKELINGIVWFSNTYNYTNLNVGEEISIDFDDSVITDRQTKLDSMRTDAITFDIPMLKIMYLVEKYNFTEEEAATYLSEAFRENEDNED